MADAREKLVRNNENEALWVKQIYRNRVSLDLQFIVDIAFVDKLCVEFFYIIDFFGMSS